MSTPVKLLAAAAVVALCAIGAAELLQRGRREPPPPPSPVGETRAESDEAADPPPARQAEHYGAIAERDLFRPLVSAPKAAGAEAAPGGAPAAGGAATKAGPPTAGSHGPGGPPGPADPLADLALTGVVQAGDRLQVLIERISTGTGSYVALHEQFDGFRVVLIGPTSVVLERGGKQYTLAMGGRQMPTAPEPRPGGPPGGPPPGAPTSSEGPSPAGRGGLGGVGFTGDMLSWAERQSLADLERMYGQYGRYLSPQDRARAEEYLESRRARERSQ